MSKTTEPAEQHVPAKRLSLSEILALVLSRSGGERSSVSLTRNAKGQTQIEVVVRTADSGDVLTIDDAMAKAKQVYDDLAETYPFVEQA